MRSTAGSLVLLLALSSCGPEAPAEPVAEGACPITAPTRLVAAPAGFEPVEEVEYGLYRFGDDILYTFDRHDDPDREYWRLNRCTGEAEPYPSLAPGLHNPYVVDTPAGRVLYGNDDAGRPYVIDRFDEPGADEARPVLGLPTGASASSSRAPHATFFLFWTYLSDEVLFNATGVGASTYAVYTHLGDPDVPALLLSDRLLRAYYFDDTHSLIHEEGGEVHLVDERTGERELVLTGVRHLSYGFDGRTFLWQALGDDDVEPVYLHHLDTGEDVQIAVNDFAALSWNRGEHRYTGEWKWIEPKAGFAAAMIGPDNRYVAAVRVDTGEALEVPEHLEQRWVFADQFRLVIARDGHEVEALWDPRTGEVREWYPDASVKPALRSIDGDIVEYFVRNPGEHDRGSLWRVDLATGQTVRLLSGIGSNPRRVGETQYFVETPRARIPGPPGADFVHWFSDLELIDVASGERRSIAEKVSAFVGVPEGLIVLDAFGAEPGLWAHPLPHDASRSASRVGPIRQPARLPVDSRD